MERIKLFTDIHQQDYMSRQADIFCDKANEKIIPLLKVLNIPQTKANIMTYAGDNDKLQADYIKREEAKLQGENEVLKRIAKEQIRKTLEEAVNLYSYYNFTFAYPDLLTVSGGKIMGDDEAITEHCTRYLADEYREQYNKLQDIAKQLTEWGNGKLENINHILFVTQEGEVKVCERIDYGYYKRK